MKIVDNLQMRVSRFIGWAKGSVEVSATAPNGLKIIIQMPKAMKHLIRDLDEDHDFLMVTIERRRGLPATSAPTGKEQE